MDTNWVVPLKVTRAKVTVVGAGAGGPLEINGGASGSGAGGTSVKIVTGLVPGDTIPITVASGGLVGESGGTSSFSTYCSATGGNPGLGGNHVPGGRGGIGIGGDLNVNGGSGGPSCYFAVFPNKGPAGFGGASHLAPASTPVGAFADEEGADGNFPGGGGTGGVAGSLGGGGCVIVEY